MNMMSDLGTDLAVAFFVEKQQRQKIESKDVPALIERIKELLQRVNKDQVIPVNISDRISHSRAH